MIFLALMRSALAIAALLLFGASYSEAAEGEVVAYEWPTAGWRVSTPEEQGMDSTALADLVDFGASRGLNSLLVARHGMIVVEAFYAPFRSGLKHRTRSVTKSVTGTLVGIAVKEGRLDRLDRPVVEFFPDRHITNLDERKRAITIQHLLDMTSGLDWNEESFVPAMHHSNDWTQFVLDRPMTASPGTGFLYNSGSSHLLSAIITMATGESAMSYARKRLFGPLGISDVFWQEDPGGISIGGYGLYLQPRDMAKLGYLYLRNGVWDGTQILPSAWAERIRDATLPSSVAGLRYANLFWVDPERKAYFALGYHGQRILVIPEQDIVAVITATADAPSAVEIGLIAKAVKSDGPLPSNTSAQTLLAERIREAATEKPSQVGDSPTLAKIISGKVYRFSDNPLRLQSLILNLEGPEPSYAYIIGPARPSAPTERFEGRIGLDGLYRMGSARPEGAVPAAKGHWSDDRTFVLQFEDLGGDNQRIAELSFDDNTIEVTSTSDEGRSAKARGEAAP
jgi:CubicO group peptidase (beta-lactamase class C family)